MAKERQTTTFLFPSSYKHRMNKQSEAIAAFLLKATAFFILFSNHVSVQATVSNLIHAPLIEYGT